MAQRIQRESSGVHSSLKQSRIPPGLESHQNGDGNGDGKLVELFSGGSLPVNSGEEIKWRQLQKFKPFTNVFICDLLRGRILLGMKKRGFGKGMYNGFGGKVEPNESPIEAAARELKEEAGITANLEECGALLFANASTEYCHYVHMYRAYEFQGEPIETEEMRPEWFAIPQEYLTVNPTYQRLSNTNLNTNPNPNINLNTNSDTNTESTPSNLPQIPLSQMWPDDEFWMPLLLKGQNYFVGRVDFGIEDGDAKKGSWRMERWWFGVKKKEMKDEKESEDVCE